MTRIHADTWGYMRHMPVFVSFCRVEVRSERAQRRALRPKRGWWQLWNAWRLQAWCRVIKRCFSSPSWDIQMQISGDISSLNFRFRIFRRVLAFQGVLDNSSVSSRDEVGTLDSKLGPCRKEISNWWHHSGWQSMRHYETIRPYKTYIVPDCTSTMSY